MATKREKSQNGSVIAGSAAWVVHGTVLLLGGS